MNVAVEPSSRPPAISPPNLRPATLDDLPQIERLAARHNMEQRIHDQWLSLWLNNPLWLRVSKTWITGWVLEDAAGRIVGSICNIPTLYKFQGRDILCSAGRGWVCDHEYRGFALTLMDEYYNQSGVDLFVNNTVSPEAMQTMTAFCMRMPLGDWQSTAYWITGYRQFAATALKARNAPLPGLLAFPAAAVLKIRDVFKVKSLPPAPAGHTIEMTESFDSRFDPFWDELVRQNPNRLLAARDTRTLNWHFAVPMLRKHVWVFTASRNGRLLAYCVLWRQGTRGVMRLIDYQTIDPQTDLLPALLQAALRRCIDNDIFIFEHFGCDIPKLKSLDDYAPYRHKMIGWPFYYQCPDPTLAAQLTNPQVWDPSEYDSDASI